LRLFNKLLAALGVTITRARPIAARLFRLAFPPQDYTCPLCGAAPGPEGYLYEVLLDEDVPAEVPRFLEERDRGGFTYVFALDADVPASVPRWLERDQASESKVTIEPGDGA